MATGAVKERGGSDDPTERFWDTLIADWVAVGVLAFGAQGLWFGLVAALAAAAPDLKPGLDSASAVLFELTKLSEGQGWPAVLGVLAGLLVGVKRALDARSGVATAR
jgi:hypothetical protein